MREQQTQYYAKTKKNEKNYKQNKTTDKLPNKVEILFIEEIHYLGGMLWLC